MRLSGNWRDAEYRGEARHRKWSLAWAEVPLHANVPGPFFISETAKET